MKRTKLAHRELPDYTRGEERMNTITHIFGAALGLAALVLCTGKSLYKGNALNCVTSIVYGLSLITLYAMSSVYHGLRPSTGKKVMQILDHCTIYFLIAGTYTPIVLGVIRDRYPAISWGLFAAEWILCAIAATLTAIDLKKYNIFSMICYIGMGWGIVFFLPQAMSAMGSAGFLLLLWGGIAYTVGAVLYGIGSKMRWMHSVFHIFVVLGSLLQFLAIYLYAL